MIDLSRIKLVGLDMDQTVLTGDKRITGRTAAAVEAAISAGVEVIAATGRPVTGVPEAFLAIPGVRYLLGSNGAAVYDRKTESFVFRSCMSKETAERAFSFFAPMTCTRELYADGIPYIGEGDFAQLDELVPDPHIRSYIRTTRNVVPDLIPVLEKYGDRIEKVNICFPTPKEAADVFETLPQLLPEVTAVRGLPFNIELSKKGTDKGEGLLGLAAILGLKREQVLACGDSENDLAMIRKAGIGAAMANAQPQVKQEADYVLPYTNEEDGVAWLLEEIIRQQEKNGRERG